MTHFHRMVTFAWLTIASTNLPLWSQFVEQDDMERLESDSAPAEAERVDASQVIKLIVDQTNAFRETQGLLPLDVNEKLSSAAQDFAGYMARTDRYGHRADGQRPSERIANHDYNYCVVAENIAYRYHSAGFQTDALAQQFFEGWKNSPEHRENMLHPAILDLGVGIARSDATGHWYAVQEFGRPESAAIEFQISNQSETEVSYKIDKKAYTLPPRYRRTHRVCNTAPVLFDLPHQDESQDPRMEPKAGDQFAILREGDHLEVRQVD